MSEHTKGPWVWNDGRAQILAQRTKPDGETLYWRDVATVEPMKAGALRGGTDPESRANARLIAAAPDLLASCRESFAALEAIWDACMSDRHPDMEQFNDAMKGARDTIEAATGVSP